MRNHAARITSAQGVPPLTGDREHFDVRAEPSDSAPTFDLPLHDVDSAPADDPSPNPPSASRGLGLPIGMLVIGLMAGFGAGFFAGQQMAVPAPVRAPDVVRSPHAETTGGVSHAQPAVVPAGSTVADVRPVDVEQPLPVRPLPAAAPAQPAAGSEPVARLGTLQIASRPQGAFVYVDDRHVGFTPVTIRDVQPGTHRVRMELTGHQAWTTTVAVEPGSELRVGASLE